MAGQELGLPFRREIAKDHNRLHRAVKHYRGATKATV